MRVAVLTTSYPRFDGDQAGSFVGDAVAALREREVEVEVVSPATFRHFGIAYGHGVAGNLRAAPWKLALVPAFLASFAAAARRAARGADLVHAHWIPSGLAALATGKPYVLQVWGTDVELARRAPALARPVLRRAALVLAASTELAEQARGLGAGEVRVVPAGVRLPETTREPEEPPHVLFVGRLSPEKGILEFLEATEGLPRVVVGDGPLRDRVPGGVGAVPHDEVGGYLDRAAVVCCPSRREGYGVQAREAMGHARPVVATRVGGLPDAVEDGVTGLLVDPGDPPALRAAVERLLGDGELRRRLGEAGRARALERFSLATAAEATLAAYREALECERVL